MTELVVQADYERLDEVAQRFTRVHDQTISLATMLNQSMQTLKDTWSGDAANAFFKEMETTIFPTMRRLHSLCSVASQVTRDIQREFRTHEEEAAKLFKGQETGFLNSPQKSSYSFGNNEQSMSDAKIYTVATQGDEFISMNLNGNEQVIANLSNEINAAAQANNVDPSLVAAILYDELNRRSFADDLQDTESGFLRVYEGWLESLEVFLWETVTGKGINEQSFGKAQMQINTLTNLIDNGYIPKPSDWDTDQLDSALTILADDTMAPMLIAARVRQTIDHWSDGGIDISQKPEILATLYSIGLEGKNGVRADPQPNERGLEIDGYRPRLQEILNSNDQSREI